MGPACDRLLTKAIVGNILTIRSEESTLPPIAAREVAISAKQDGCLASSHSDTDVGIIEVSWLVLHKLGIDH